MSDDGPDRTLEIDGERFALMEFAFPGPLRDELIAAVLRGEKTARVFKRGAEPFEIKPGMRVDEALV